MVAGGIALCSGLFKRCLHKPSDCVSKLGCTDELSTVHHLDWIVNLDTPALDYRHICFCPLTKYNETGLCQANINIGKPP